MGVLAWVAAMVAVAAIATLFGYLGSTLARRNRRRVGIPFVVGFICGSITGTTLRRRVRQRYISRRVRGLLTAPSR